jgi:hypothetical protein
MHKGKKIMYVDYTHCKSPEEMIKVLYEVKAEYERTTEMFISVADFRGCYGSSEFLKEAQKVAREIIDQRTSKTAVLGVTGIKKVLLQSYNAFIKHKMVPFDTKEQAFEYLVKD